MAEGSEYGRLRELYGTMPDGELAELASEPHELTQCAHQALFEEICRRGLIIPESREIAHSEPEPQDLVMLRRFRDLPEAMLAKGMLDSAAIECFLADENIIRLDWFYSNLVGGIKLMVRQEDVEAAEGILSQPIPHEVDYGTGEIFEQPKCPQCGSLDISFEELDKTLSYGSAWLGVPIPIQSPKWRCADCAAVWVDDEGEASSGSTEEMPQP